MDYSQYALENAVLTLLPEAQKNKPSDITHLFPKITEKYFLLTVEPSSVEKACYKVIKAALSDINSHNLVTYGKKELAYEILEQYKIELMDSNQMLPPLSEYEDSIPELKTSGVSDIHYRLPSENSQDDKIPV